ncbi:MAG: hypothetical protein E6049_00380 [Varibaculum cambriense]|nr:hypothetical protein [Varibaculum cambriense]
MNAKKHLSGLVQNSDHGSLYSSITYNEKLANWGIKPSTCGVGDT